MQWVDGKTVLVRGCQHVHNAQDRDSVQISGNIVAETKIKRWVGSIFY